MSTTHRPSPTAAVLTGAGALLTTLALTRLTWGTDWYGDGFSFLDVRGELIDEFADGDTNSKIQAAYASWGFGLMIASAVGSCVALWTRLRSIGAAIVVLLLAFIGWHQALISGLLGLHAAARLPMVGAAICCVGLLVQIVHTTRRGA
ncbi:MAG: hypothetical protein HZB15_00340 [Actinobacteria bacterium]|nr:hypothetical protein [Actinomycetota bacterium]